MVVETFRIRSPRQQFPTDPYLMKLAPILLRLTAGVALALASVADAALTPVATRPGLGSVLDFVSWSSLGAEFTTPANPFSISSVGGLSLTVGKTSAGTFERVDEGGFGWTGNFALGDALLWTSLTSGPINIDFGTSVFGAGFQIQNDSLGAFQATLEAFDFSNASLGSFTFNGTSTQAQDNSAIFAGVLSTSSDVRRLSVNVTGSSSFAINQVTIAAIPEPGTALFGMACFATLAMRRTSRRR